MTTIEILTESNIDPLTNLATELWPDTAFAELREHFQTIMTNPNATVILLKNSKDYIGFIELSTQTDYVEGADQLPVAYIEGVFVVPDFRNKGFGAMLLEHAENWAQENGLTQICSDTGIENEGSINFHKASGFEEVSRIICFIKKLKRNPDSQNSL